MALLVGREIYDSNAARSTSSPFSITNPHISHSCILGYNDSSTNKHFPTRADPEVRLNLI